VSQAETSDLHIQFSNPPKQLLNFVSAIAAGVGHLLWREITIQRYLFRRVKTASRLFRIWNDRERALRIARMESARNVPIGGGSGDWFVLSS
jgi:hypothetical protein